MSCVTPQRHELMQNVSRETLTFRNTASADGPPDAPTRLVPAG